jgi:hypothetical protein
VEEIMQRRNVAPLGLALVALAGGCVADSGDGGILVLRNVVADAMCSTLGNSTEVSRSHGTLDLLAGSGYVFIAQMKSRITALVGQEDQRTIITSGANVDVAFPGSTLFSDTELADLKSAALTHFKSPFSQVIFPNGGISDGFFELIPGELVRRIAAKFDLSKRNQIEAVATFTIVGDMSGETVTSQPFSYAVTIGNELTVNILGTCPLAKATMVRTGYACNAAQDGEVDCCASRKSDTDRTVVPGSLSCPAIVSM